MCVGIHRSRDIAIHPNNDAKYTRKYRREIIAVFDYILIIHDFSVPKKQHNKQ